MEGRAPGFRSVLAELYGRAPQGMRLGLDAIGAACARAGHPERAFEVVHVGGTNGKGSVSAMVDAMARADHRRVGLYTSPHLCRFAERIRIGGEPIGDDALEGVLRRALDLGPDLSFFEAATLAALLAFRDAAVDLAVLEVGIGGRLDATNVVAAPRVTAVTRVAFDHMAVLGATLPAIAAEKAAIAKPGVPLVVGPVDDEVWATIQEVAARRGGAAVRAEDDEAAQALVAGAPIALAGAHQRDNAQVAAAIALRAGLSPVAIRRGLAEVRWPGRLERIEAEGVAHLLDGAHNPDGAAALARHLQATPSSKGSTALVFGALADKEWGPTLDALAPFAAHRFYVAPRGRAAADPAQAALRHAGTPAKDAAAALAAARSAALAGASEGPPLVVVAGSLYLVGEARARLLGLAEDPPVAL